MKKTIQNIVRGVCLKGDLILLAFHKECEYHFLPGGHLEFGESLTNALEREFMEEMGCASHCRDLITVFEHRWDNKGVIQHEINFYFSIELADIKSPIRSNVKHLLFEWVPVSRLEKIKFLPSAALQPIIKSIVGDTSVPRLISTLKN